MTSASSASSDTPPPLPPKSPKLLARSKSFTHPLAARAGRSPEEATGRSIEAASGRSLEAASGRSLEAASGRSLETKFERSANQETDKPTRTSPPPVRGKPPLGRSNSMPVRQPSRQRVSRSKEDQGFRGTWAPGGKPSQREPLPGTQTHQWVDFKSDGKEKKGREISNQIK